MKICTIAQCKRTYYAKGFCEGHYKRNRLGISMEKGFRTTHRPAIKLHTTALIPLGINAKDGYAVVDLEDSVIEKSKWSLQKRGYAVAYIDKQLVLMHHLILGKPKKGLVIDHINRNKLDNRKDNLRFVKQEINTRNAHIPSTNTSGFKGVTYEKRRRKWAAQLVYRGKNHFGGYYDTIEEAAEGRKRLEQKLINGRT